MVAESTLDRLRATKLTLLVETEQEGDRTIVLASDRSGLAPLRDATFEHPHLLDGADAAMPAVGLAAAYLLIHSKVGRVLAGVMTQEARRALEEEGIEHKAEHVQKRLPEEAAATWEPLDARAREAVTPLAFVEDLRRTGG